MLRNLKALAVALATAFAFAAMASAASAVPNEHHVNGTVGDKYTVVDAETTEQVFTPTTGGTEGFSCKKVAVNGEVEVATATSVTVEPIYNECKTHGGLGAVVNTEKCHYTFQGLTTEGNPTADGSHANVVIKCDTAGAGSEIKIRVSGFACAAVPPQTIKHAVRYEDLANGKITITATAHGFTSTTEGVCKSKESPEEVEGKQTHTNGVYTGNVVVDTQHGLSLSTT